MRKSLVFLVAAFAALGSSASASPITYDWSTLPLIDEQNQPVSVTGTITTDGALGPISPSDITSWNLTLSDGSNSFSANSSTPGNDFYILGVLVATASQLELPTPSPVPFPASNLNQLEVDIDDTSYLQFDSSVGWPTPTTVAYGQAPFWVRRGTTLQFPRAFQVPIT